MDAGLIRVVLIFDLCNFHSLHLLMNRISSDSNMVFIIIKTMMFTEGQIFVGPFICQTLVEFLKTKFNLL